MPSRRARSRSTSCSSTTSQSSMVSIYPRLNQSSPLAEPTEGYTNVHGSFTTTLPAAIWLRNRLSLDIPLPGICHAEQHTFDCSYDSPPDSPLSFFSGSKRSPSISRTLLSDLDCGSFSSPVSSPPSSSPSSPSLDNDDTKLHPVLKVLERGSKFSCSTVCSTCLKAGTNYPRCPRCGESWCSRECRLQGGKKHRCATREI